METAITLKKEAIAPQVKENKPLKKAKFIFGLELMWVEIGIRLNIIALVIRFFKNPFTILNVLRKLDQNRRAMLGNQRLIKLAKVGQKYYWDLYTPGWKSVAFENAIIGEINRIQPIKSFPTNRLTNAFVAITKKCPLQCEHCFEWENLNKKEVLTDTNLETIIHKLSKIGVSQIQLTGGEPLMRMDDILPIVEKYPHIDFWFLTSGYNLTLDKAKKMKKAGIAGIVVSIDHYIPDFHNQFRGNPNSFSMAINAVSNAINEEINVALSICVSKSFVNEADLMNYMEFARELGVTFVQILEPKSIGHYQGLSVTLEKKHFEILDNFFLKMNYDPAFINYPIISYHGYYQRKAGCFASGNRNIYINTDGDINACPFCPSKVGNAISDDILLTINQLEKRGCGSYNNVKF